MLEIQPATIVWTAINLLILYFFFKKFLFGRLNAMLERRAALMEQELSQAEAQKNEAQQLKADYAQKLAQAQLESAQIVALARQRGQREYESLFNAARSDADKLRKDTWEQLESERELMVRQARKEVASLALLAAAKVSGRVMDQDADRALINAFLSESGELE